MLNVYNLKNLREVPILASNMFSDRQKQFVDRQKWNLNSTPLGHEYDDYDDDDTIYLIAHIGNKHLASMRLRSLSDRNMLSEKFGRLLLSAPPLPENALEVSRFCISPKDTEDSYQVIRSLFGLAANFADSIGSEAIVGIFSKKMSPVYERYLMSPNVLSEIVSDGDRICLGLWDSRQKAHISIAKNNGSREVA